MIGGALAGWTNRAGRWPVVVLGLLCTAAACALILLNIPNDALLSSDGSGAARIDDVHQQKGLGPLPCSTTEIYFIIRSRFGEVCSCCS